MNMLLRVLLALFIFVGFPYGNPTKGVQTMKESARLSAKLGCGGVVLKWDAMPEAIHGYFIYKMHESEGEYRSYPLTDFPILGTEHVTTKELEIGSKYCFKVFAVGESHKQIDSVFTNEACIVFSHCYHTLKLAIGSSTIYIDREKETIDVPPEIYHERTYVPFRVIVETIGATVDWDPLEKAIHIHYDSPNEGKIMLVLQINNPIAWVNGEEVYIDPNDPSVVPRIKEARTLIPLRFVGESLGLQLDWISETKEILIYFEK